MGLRYTLAKAAGTASRWGLRRLGRNAGNVPGKIARVIDPDVLSGLGRRCSEGSIITVGTNGKTSTNNLLADIFEAAGKTVVCNRSGANLTEGIASALLQTKQAQWGLFECDELWLALVLPRLKSDYVLLLNLFRDQLDRCGEIDRIQTSIAGALASSPDTVLIYNGDDPLCAAIANAVDNRSYAFGLEESMELAQNTVTDAQMCQQCNGMIRYRYRQYGQLGDYYCEQCDFARPPLAFAGSHISMSPRGVSVDVRSSQGCERVSTPQATPYAVYNLIAAYAVCSLTDIPLGAFQKAVDAFNPRNGRLQRYCIDGHDVLLNLAKNPTGFNQNLKIIEVDRGPKVAAFFINDNLADGRDISWIWDIDFEELADHQDTVVFAGGTRAYDVAVRLKYAGIRATVVEDIADVFGRLKGLVERGVLPEDAGVYAIANYTALPTVHRSLDAMEAHGGESGEASRDMQPASLSTTATESDASMQGEAPVVIAHVLPDLLNLYGDGGNIRVLEQRLKWRGIPVEVRRIHHNESIDLTEVDLVFMGGGPDREQKLASEQLLAMRDDLAAYVEADGPLLAICGGYQILGRQWLWGDELVPGLGLLAMETRRPGTSADRLIDNMVLESPLATHPVVGYENHAGRTYLDKGLEGFGRVVSSCGHGNNDTDRIEGARYRNIVGTYSHGPLLSKNPEVADWLLQRALERWASRYGQPAPQPLEPLDDSEELAANAVMVKRLS